MKRLHHLLLSLILTAGTAPGYANPYMMQQQQNPMMQQQMMGMYPMQQQVGVGGNGYDHLARCGRFLKGEKPDPNKGAVSLHNISSTQAKSTEKNHYWLGLKAALAGDNEGVFDMPYTSTKNDELGVYHQKLIDSLDKLTSEIKTAEEESVEPSDIINKIKEGANLAQTDLSSDSESSITFKKTSLSEIIKQLSQQKVNTTATGTKEREDNYPNKNQETILENIKKYSKDHELNNKKFDKKVKVVVREFYGEAKQCALLYATVQGFIEKQEDNSVGQRPTSADGQIQCVSAGEGTLDFPACSKAVMAYDVAFVAKAGLTQIQAVNKMDKMMDAQAKAMQDPNDPTVGLQVQKKSIKEDAKAANQMAVADAASAAALLTIYRNYPDADSLIDGCKEKKEVMTAQADEVNKLNVIEVAINESDDCSDFVSNYAAQTLLLNQPAREKVKIAMIQAGMNIAVNVAKANVLEDQASKVQDAINQVEGFEPLDINYSALDQQVTQCQIDPTADGCAAILANRDVGFGDETITMNGFGNVSYGGSGGTDSSQGARAPAEENSDITDRSDAVGSFGSAQPTKASGGGLTDKIAGVGVKKGVPATSGGGGGGGAPAGGAAGGGGGGAAPSGQGGGGGTTISKDGEGISYSGKSRGLNFTGGSRYKKKSKQKVDNPFASMFGKKKGGKPRDLNFGSGKNGVAPRGRDIFSMIDARYNVVESRGDLLKYELDGTLRLPASTVSPSSPLVAP